MAALGYVDWEEVFVSNDKGRREVHYHLKRRDGGSDLAVIGKEKSLRHMSYRFALRNRPLISTGLSSSFSKLKSRREVIDWLNSIVSDPYSHEPSQSAADFLNGKDAFEWNVETLKDVQLRKLGHYTKAFLWLGSPWTCRKKRNHYPSFCRNGVKIHVHDFVYVLAEEDKRLVAYLEDMYEDSRGNKMVVVRWFHKIDEVGIVLPHNFNEREIFSSLCFQDLSVECIDGLATVLSPQHFEKFLNEATHIQVEPFICHKQFENDEVKPFDITQIKGYWKQEILRYMFTVSSSKDYVNSQHPDDSLKAEGNVSDAEGFRPRKSHRRSKDGDVYEQCTDRKESTVAACLDGQFMSNSFIGCKSAAEMRSVGGSATLLSKKEVKQSSPQYLKVGSHVEVLSQDSGMRGCWFRALIIKRHKDRVKVQYQDIQDGADEANKLEEWILASRVAAPEQLGIRICGRTTVRPPPHSNKGRVSWVVDVGTVVDVWWHDGWWEGIVVQKESEDKFHVYFPGEKRESVFGLGKLRHSQEWLGNGWTHIKERPDVVKSILFDLGRMQLVKSSDGNLAQATVCDSRQSRKNESGCSDSPLDSGNDNTKECEVVPDLSKDDLLAQLKWKSSRKRRQTYGNSVHKQHYNDNSRKTTQEVMESGICEKFLISSTLKVDHEKCKYMGDSLFSSSVVPPLTSLVMSR